MPAPMEPFGAASVRSNRGRRTSAVFAPPKPRIPLEPARSWTDSTGSTPASSRFHLPMPSGPKRSARVPPGSTGFPSLFRTRARKAAFSFAARSPPRSAAVRNLPGTYAPSRFSRRTRNGPSV